MLHGSTGSTSTKGPRRPIIMEHLTALLSTPEQYSILLVERAVVGLLRLGRILASKVGSISDFSLLGETHFQLQPNLRDQLYVSFDLLAGLHPTVQDAIAEQIVRGLLMIVNQNKDIVRYGGAF
jgi:golgi-specific brefeldin A-resistance guanine nucleotide exchange factor 1